MKWKMTIFVAIGTLTLASGALAAMIDGTSGNDHLRGTMQADVIRAFAGDDFANARAGNDLVRAGAGADVVRHDERDNSRLTGEEPVRQLRAFLEPLDRLAGATTGDEHPVVAVHDDDSLAALLEQHPGPRGVGVHAHRVLTDA